MSFVLLVTGFPKPEHRAEVTGMLERSVASAQKKPGVELFALYEADDRLLVVEQFASDEALEQWLQAPEYIELSAGLEGKLEGYPDIQRYTPHPVGDDKGVLR